MVMCNIVHCVGFVENVGLELYRYVSGKKKRFLLLFTSEINCAYMLISCSAVARKQMAVNMQISAEFACTA